MAETPPPFDGTTGDSRLASLLFAWRTGDAEALDELVARLYRDLRAISGHLMSRERRCLTLQPTAVVNEAYLRMRDLQAVRVKDREAFLGLASRIMRNVLVDFARSRDSQKRGGDVVKVSTDGLTVAEEQGALLDVVAFDQALETLEAMDPRLARQVELRVFGGLTETEVGEVLEISRATVQRDWAVAKRWLVRRLAPEGAG